MAKTRRPRTKVVTLNPQSEPPALVAIAVLDLLDSNERQKLVLLRLLEATGYNIESLTRKIDPDLVVWLVFNIFGVDVKNAKGKIEKIVAARHAARYLLHIYSGIGSWQIASLTGTRDHSTVLRSIKKIKEFKETIVGFDEKLKLCIKKLEPEIMSYGRQKIST